MWGEIEKRNLYVTDRILLSSQRRPAAGTVQRRLLRRGLYGHLGQDLPKLAAEIAPDWDLPAEAVQSGLETLRSHLELVQGDAALLYEML